MPISSTTQHFDNGNNQTDGFDIFMPWATEEEKALRRRLRDLGLAAQRRAERAVSDDGRALCWQVASAAPYWAGRRTSMVVVESILRGCSQMMMAADNFDRAEAGDAA